MVQGVLGCFRVFRRGRREEGEGESEEKDGVDGESERERVRSHFGSSRLWVSSCSLASASLVMVQLPVSGQPWWRLSAALM